MSEELQDFVLEYGREMFIRQSTGQRCSCYNDLTRESDRECTSCSGFGWVYVDRKILAYRSMIADISSDTFSRIQSTLGTIVSDRCVVFFEIKSQTAYASEHDWIIECRTRSNGCLWPPYKIERIWDLTEVSDFRDLHGQFSFYQGKCRRIALGK